MSLGQLDEGDYDVHIEHEVLNIWDAKGRLLAQVQCLANHLYIPAAYDHCTPALPSHAPRRWLMVVA